MTALTVPEIQPVPLVLAAQRRKRLGREALQVGSYQGKLTTIHARSIKRNPRTLRT
jgi:hypothetical protein